MSKQIETLDTFEATVRAHAFKGMQMPEDHPAIEKDYCDARAAMTEMLLLTTNPDGTVQPAGTFVAMVGNPINGVRLYGPATHDQCDEWLHTQTCSDDEWWIVPVTPFEAA